MENIKEAFLRVKEEILNINSEVNFLKGEILDTREKIIELCNLFEKISWEKTNEYRQTNKQINKTNNSQNKTNNLIIKSLNTEILPISIGNQGVQTNKQTNKQTDKQPNNSFDEVMEALNSLDKMKKEIRLKFKRLTEQEVLVFSTIYQIEEEKGFTDYKTLSQRLNLSESSIRDYVRRLILKEIPLEKKKLNNKEIHLFISTNLKKVASLTTILELREL